MNNFFSIYRPDFWHNVYKTLMHFLCFFFIGQQNSKGGGSNMIIILVSALFLHQLRHSRLNCSKPGILVHLRHSIIVDNTDDQYTALLLVCHLFPDGFLETMHFKKSCDLIHIIIRVLQEQITTKYHDTVHRISKQKVRKYCIFKNLCHHNCHRNCHDPFFNPP